MKILFLTVGDRTVASSRARVYSYTPRLKRAGIRSIVINYSPSWQCRKILLMERVSILEKIIGKLYSAIKLLLVFLAAPFSDVVYIQKVCLSKINLSILKILNKRIIFDFDDAVYLYKDISDILKAAKSIVVSNPSLKKFASNYNDRVYVVATAVEPANGSMVKKSDPVLIGWTGSPETSKYLDLLLPVLRRLIAAFRNIEVVLMGSGRKAFFEQNGIRVLDWSLDGEQKFLGDIDIGLMPLEDDEWSGAKAGYKLLLYMSQGVAPVASPVGVNREIIRDGLTGFLAGSQNEWLDRVSLLIKDAELRMRMGKDAREYVGKYYSYEAVLPQFLESIK